MTTATITVAPKPEKKKTPQEIEIERLSALAPEDLNAEDLRILRRIRDTRASLLEAEKELEEVKERKKLRAETLDEAIREAAMYFENRQLALNFGR